MSQPLNRREVLGAAGAALLGSARALAAPADVEVRISQVSPHTFRINIGGDPPDDGALVQPAWGAPLATLRGAFAPRTVKAAGVVIKATSNPLSFAIETAKGEPIQHLKLDPDTGVVSFAAGTVPLLALGEGGPQFDRRGANIPSRSGQGGFQLRTYGGRVPIQWLIGTGGWALFVHVPYGSFDLTGAEGKFVPPSKDGALPLDLFFVTSKEPAVLMTEYALITGHPELPPLWSFGYQQSHRTLASREEILGEAKTFREKKLPCDALIYLGTGFCPSGWNTDNTEFTWNSKVFPDPKAMLDQLHQDHFKVVLHIAYPTGLEKVEPARLRAMSREAVDALSHSRNEAAT